MIAHEFRKTNIRGLLATIVASVVFAANAATNFFWTGGAGDHLWSSPANWSLTDGGANLGPGEGPTSDVSTYRFLNMASDLVVTQDIDVVSSYLGGSSAGTAEVSVKIVGIDNHTWKFSENFSPWMQKNIRIELNVDMSAQTTSCTITPRSTDSPCKGHFAFNLTAANPALLTIDSYDSTLVEVVEGSVCPYLSVLNGGEDESQDEHKRIFASGLAGETSLFELFQTQGSYTHPYYNYLNVNKYLFRVETAGPLSIGGGANNATTTNDLSGFVFESGGTASFSFAEGRVAQFHSLPFAPAFSADRARYEFAAKPALARLCFNDADNPMRDDFGSGNLIFDPSGDENSWPSVVSDAERGSVLRFAGDASSHCGLCGSGASYALPDFAPATTGFTIAFWIKPDDDCSAKARLLFFGTISDQRRVQLRLNDGTGSSGTGKYLMLANTSTAQYCCDSDLRGSWHHIALTYRAKPDMTSTAAYETLYVDGAQVGRWSWPRSFTGANFWVGQTWTEWAAYGADPYKGLMDDFVVLDFPLTAREVASLKNGGLAAFRPVPAVEAKTTADVVFAYTNVAVAALSGDSASAAVTVPDGGTLTVGAEESPSTASYAGAFGGNVSLVKNGASFAQTLSGDLSGVTNVCVREGTLVLSGGADALSLPPAADVAVVSGATLRVASSGTANVLTGAGTVEVDADARFVVADGSGFTGTVMGAGRYRDLSKKQGFIVFVK